MGQDSLIRTGAESESKGGVNDETMPGSDLDHKKSTVGTYRDG